MIFILWCLLLSVPVCAMNSQVTSEGIARMVDAGVDKTVVAYLVTQQTCAVGPGDVIRMTRAGLEAEDIIAAIASDRCRKPENATVYDEIAIIERLKKAGLSDEAILQYLDRIKSRHQVDPDGRTVHQYGNTPGRAPCPVEGSRLPEDCDRPDADIFIYRQP